VADATRRVLVTGAAKGIGAAIARRCVERGHAVIAADVDREGLELLRAELPAAEVRELDVTDLEQWHSVVTEVETNLGPIDVLINNAGVCRPGRGHQVPVEDDRLTFEVNVLGVIYGVRTLLPRFLDRERGHVINVASMAAFAPAPDLAAYCASKHAVRAYTHACALDYRHAPVRWTLACPSAVETPMLQSMRNKRAGAVVFTEKPMPPSAFAERVVAAIERPRREVLVPSLKGQLIRVLGLFPGLIARGIDSAERRGLEAIDRR